jgi:hypothetical protein
MGDETKVYVAVDGPHGHLRIDGPLDLLRQFLDAMGDHPEHRADVKAAGRQPVAAGETAASVTSWGKEATDAPSA